MQRAGRDMAMVGGSGKPSTLATCSPLQLYSRASQLGDVMYCMLSFLIKRSEGYSGVPLVRHLRCGLWALRSLVPSCVACLTTTQPMTRLLGPTRTWLVTGNFGLIGLSSIPLLALVCGRLTLRWGQGAGTAGRRAAARPPRPAHP